MSESSLQVFLLCLIVFIISALFLVFIVIYVYKLEARSINSGILDEEIKRSYLKQKRRSNINKILSGLFSFFMLTLVCSCFAFGLTTYFTNYDKVGDFPAYKVVLSTSMEEKNEENTYLFENNLDNQISMYDLVVVKKLPDEFDINLYDIVVYQSSSDELVIHRIVNIEEPNEEHPDSRLFTFQGDNITSPDSKKVTYSQMKGIYSNYRIPYVGKIVVFFQSYAGYLCVGITIFYVIVSPFIEKKQEKLINKRIELINANETKEEEAI